MKQCEYGADQELNYGEEFQLLGEGILKGMAETARNFSAAMSRNERLTTVEYPEQRIAAVEAARVFPFLVYDGDRDWEAGLRCVACQICEKECPPKCIYIEKINGQEAGRTSASRSFIRRVSTSIFRSA